MISLLKIKAIIPVILLSLFVPNTLNAQSEKVIASVGTKSISFDEFKFRFELTPGFSFSVEEDDIEGKRNFLFTLIAEYLWAEEAKERGFDTSLVMRYSFPVISKMYLRNELWKREIESKVSVKESEIQSAIEKEKFTLRLNFIHSIDSTEIFSIFNLLRKGADFDSLFLSREEAKLQTIPLEVTFGKLDENLEDFLYSLNRNIPSIPYKKSEGWFIYLLRDKVESISDGKDVKQRISNVKSILTQRKTELVYQQFYKNFFASKRVETNGDLFWSLFDKIHLIYSNIKTDSLQTTKSYKLSIKDIKDIESSLGTDTLLMTFMTIEGENISLQAFIRNFVFEGFYSEPISENLLAAKLNQRVKSFIELELLSKEAERRGFQNLPEVKNAIDRWKNFYLAEEFRYSMTDSIQIENNDLEEYFSSVKNDSLILVKINLAEILTDSLEVVEKVLKELTKGEDFSELAKKYSKVIWNRNNGGELGLLPASALGEKGRIALQLTVGEVYGPLKTETGYSIFKLLEKREDDIDRKSSIANDNQLKQEMAYRKIEQFLKDKTIEYAKKYNVKVNDDLLYNTQMKNLKMYIIQYIGFGGRLPAVPSTSPFIKWYDEYLKQSEIP